MKHVQYGTVLILSTSAIELTGYTIDRSWICAVAVDAAGNRYLIGEHLLYPWMENPDGTRYIDTRNAIMMPDQGPTK